MRMWLCTRKIQTVNETLTKPLTESTVRARNPLEPGRARCRDLLGVLSLCCVGDLNVFLEKKLNSVSAEGLQTFCLTFCAEWPSSFSSTKFKICEN